MTNGDLVYTTFLDTVDAYVKRRRMELPEDPDARTTFADPPCVTAPLTHLDLAAEGISAVIWATGYGVDFGWIDLPVLDARGEARPSQRHLGGARSVFPRPAMAVENELLVPVRRRRRRRRARRPYSGAAALVSPLAGKGAGCAASEHGATQKNAPHVNPFTSALHRPCSGRRMGPAGGHAMIYGGFEIQSFEAGRGLWHARIQRADQAPVMIDGMAFPTLEVGFAWSNPEAAIADAKAHIDRFKPGFANPDKRRNGKPDLLTLSRSDPPGDANALELPGLQRRARGAAHHPRPRRRRILDHAMHPLRRDPSGCRQSLDRPADGVRRSSPPPSRRGHSVRPPLAFTVGRPAKP